MKSLTLPKLTFWRVVVALIFGAGLYATFLRFIQGFQASTNLTDPVPWGLWVGLNTLCGVGLSAGGFAIAAAVYILGLERYRPVLRASILISFLGYVTVISGMMYELGLPWRIWHPIVMWNFQSVLFDVAWCVMLYTTVLALEFSPAMFERFRLHKLGEWQHRILIGLVLAGVILSSGHQSFLGGLYLIMKGKLYPLWYSSQLPALFFASAIAAGLALTIMVLYLSVRSLGVRVDFRILQEVSRVIVLVLGFYAVFRGIDLLYQGNARYLLERRSETGWFWLEVALLVVAPLILYNLRRVQMSPLGLYWTSALVVMGFMANRINVSVTGLAAAASLAGVNYVPKWSDMAVSLAIFTAAAVAFRYAVLYLPIFPRVAQTIHPQMEWHEGATFVLPPRPTYTVPQSPRVH